MSKDERLTSQVQCKMYPSEHQEIRDLANYAGVKESALVRELIRIGMHHMKLTRRQP